MTFASRSSLWKGRIAIYFDCEEQSLTSFAASYDWSHNNLLAAIPPLHRCDIFPKNNYLCSVLYAALCHISDRPIKMLVLNSWLILNWMAAIFIARINNGMYFSPKKHILCTHKGAFRKCFQKEPVIIISNQ